MLGQLSPEAQPALDDFICQLVEALLLQQVLALFLVYFPVALLEQVFDHCSFTLDETLRVFGLVELRLQF